ncbi:MAG: T9SS type A sorting domain-containing protein, partial [Bacteroidales bacterium]|nr:T9SS type A sorting domain-containing protein [Bacteroidales bacterium]
NIFPNPTSGLVTIEAENINYIAIYNSVGQLVNVVKSENNTVDMSSYDNGVYYFNIVDNAGQNSLQRVVVAK